MEIIYKKRLNDHPTMKAIPRGSCFQLSQYGALYIKTSMDCINKAYRGVNLNTGSTLFIDANHLVIPVQCHIVVEGENR